KHFVSVVYRRRFQVIAHHQFAQALNKNTTQLLFGLLKKYRPENPSVKIQRLKAKAEAKAAGKEEPPAKKTNRLRQGANTFVKLVEHKKAQLVVITHDVVTIVLVIYLPALSRKMGIPCCIIKDKSRLGTLVFRKTCTCVALNQVDKSDRANLSKLVETIKTNFNDRYQEIRKYWGGGLLGPENMVCITKKAKARELTQKTVEVEDFPRPNR
ncbi:60S ribosomal protein L7a-like, partial [Uranotaenia lowii]|uniref:60S ribosomal protein L7a-like n=1 Tax=Uranotaenia lowii TaxID=190385 RepID=UPI00247A9239